MGVKGLLKYLYNTKTVFQKEEICSALKQHETDIIFIDFCCMFYELLQRCSGFSIIKQSIEKKAWDTKDPEFIQAIDELVDAILERVRRLRKGKPKLNVCLVIDGSTMRAKFRTCKQRNTEKKIQEKINFVWKVRVAIRNNLLTRKDVFLYRNHVKPNSTSCMDTMNNNRPQPPQQLNRSNSNKKNKGKIFFHVARFEADPELVYLCSALPSNQRGAIMSGDSDLFAYPGAFDALRIIAIDWEQMPMPVTVTTKAKVFQGLGFSSKKLRQFNETKMAVLAALCGNDYAENIKHVTLNDILQVIQKIIVPIVDDPNADTLMKIVLDRIVQENQVPKPKRFEIRRFNIALHQFCIPLISGITYENENNNRCCFYPGLPINMDDSIIGQLGKEDDLLPWSEDEEEDTLHENPIKIQQQKKQELQQAQNRFLTLSLETHDDTVTQCQEIILRATRPMDEGESELDHNNGDKVEDQKETMAATTATVVKEVSPSINTKTIVQVNFDKDAFTSLLSSSKAKLFVLALSIICYYPLLICFFYIYLVIILFLCTPFILALAPRNPSYSSSSLR
ncbi:hypothetical protein BDA99DRAFT_575282 [Phascolomyces articulosus]|uniref:Exonuclease 1 n=1 Tax=Phascolomyces articulosus TaxID=60185 RepID=A0AAD5P9I7_9FUNG|nr:hypothetical protein BDA99DRAFT_575282 [Phascolomyces articulosus]